MLYNVDSATTRAITTARSAKSTPRISGTRVIWADSRNGDDDVYSVDIATGIESLIAGGAGSQTVGDISGNRIVYSSTDANGANGAVYVFTLSGPPASDLPPGCDPAKTDLVANTTTTLTQSARRPVYANKTFQAQVGSTYYLCVDNGRADGSQRTTHILGAVDNALVLMPSDFRPEKDPQRHVAQKLAIGADYSHGHAPRGTLTHRWDAALFADSNATITVSIRVAK
jgi:beta propeller repeat protein